MDCHKPNRTWGSQKHIEVHGIYRLIILIQGQENSVISTEQRNWHDNTELTRNGICRNNMILMQCPNCLLCCKKITQNFWQQNRIFYFFQYFLLKCHGIFPVLLTQKHISVFCVYYIFCLIDPTQNMGWEYEIWGWSVISIIFRHTVCTSSETIRSAFRVVSKTWCSLIILYVP